MSPARAVEHAAVSREQPPLVEELPEPRPDVRVGRHRSAPGRPVADLAGRGLVNVRRRTSQMATREHSANRENIRVPLILVEMNKVSVSPIEPEGIDPWLQGGAAMKDSCRSHR